MVGKKKKMFFSVYWITRISTIRWSVQKICSPPSFWDIVVLTFSKTCYIIPHFYDFFFFWWTFFHWPTVSHYHLTWLCLISADHIFAKAGYKTGQRAHVSEQMTWNAVSDCLTKHCKLWNLSWSCFSTDLQFRIIWFWLFLTFFPAQHVMQSLLSTTGWTVGLVFSDVLEKVNVNLTWKGYGAFSMHSGISKFVIHQSFCG